MSDLTFHKITWQQLAQDCLIAAEKAKKTPIDKIVAISRGGLVPARIISDILNVGISHITMSSYSDMKQVKEPFITEVPSKTFDNETILIVDEVSDTGKTLHHAISYFNHFHIKKIYTLSPYIKPKTTFTPDFWSTSIDAWIVFPYDIRETYDSFFKMYQDKDKCFDKMKQIGFEGWELEKI